jgi:hypothetical protein
VSAAAKRTVYVRSRGVGNEPIATFVKHDRHVIIARVLGGDFRSVFALNRSRLPYEAVVGSPAFLILHFSTLHFVFFVFVPPLA